MGASGRGPKPSSAMRCSAATESAKVGYMSKKKVVTWSLKISTAASGLCSASQRCIGW